MHISLSMPTWKKLCVSGNMMNMARPERQRERSIRIKAIRSILKSAICMEIRNILKMIPGPIPGSMKTNLFM